MDIEFAELVASEVREMLSELHFEFPFFHEESNFFEIEAFRRLSIRRKFNRDFGELLGAPPDACGNEHEVWLFPPDVYKSTYQNLFGFLPWGAKASPLDYFRRIFLTNYVFGDQISIEGVWIDRKETIRIVTKQPFSEGRNATEAEIEQLFEERGFHFVEGESPRPFWARREDNLEICVGDMHTHNVLVSPDGIPVVIDAIVATRCALN